MRKYLDSLQVAITSFFEFSGDIFAQWVDDTTTYIVEDILDLYEKLFQPIEENIEPEIDEVIESPVVEQNAKVDVIEPKDETSSFLSGSLSDVNTDEPIDWADVDTEVWDRDWFSLEKAHALLVKIPEQNAAWDVNLSFYSKMYKALSVKAGEEQLPVNTHHRSLFAVRVQMKNADKVYDKVIYQPYSYFLSQRQQFQMASGKMSDEDYNRSQALFGCIGMFTLNRHMPFIYETLGFSGMPSVIHIPPGEETTYFHPGGMI